MWFIIFCICFVLLGLIVRASSPKKKHVKQNIRENKPQLLSDQIDERLGVKSAVCIESQTRKMSFDQIAKYRWVMDSNLSSEYFVAHLTGQKHFNVGIGLIEIWERDLAEYKRKEKALHDTASNNNKGIAFEKSGDVTNAIATYEKNLEIAYPALHSYERLMILYRREKRYEDEIRVIEKALTDFSTKSHKVYIEKWNNRLQKAQKLNAK